MNLLPRLKDILLDPAGAWTRIDEEQPTVSGVATGWLLPLAVLGAVASFLGLWLFGAGGIGVTMRFGFAGAFGLALHGQVGMLLMVAISSARVSALAPVFGGTRGYARAFALMSYGAAGALVGGFAGIVPMLSFVGLVGALYSVYLVYKGLPVMMKSAPGKSVPYMLVLFVASFVVSVGIGALGWRAGFGTGSGDAQVVISTPAGEVRTTQSGIEQATRKFEEVARKLESGVRGPIEANAERTPIPAQALKDWLPAELAGLARKRFEVSDGNVVGIGGSSARATYGADARRIEIEILDAGSASGLLSAFAGLHSGEKETDGTVERSRQVGSRRVVEKRFKDGSRAEVTTILANGVMVQAEARGMGLDELNMALERMDLGRLETR